MPSHILRPVLLEVERKFPRLALPTLTLTSGIPPFQSLLALPTIRIHDIYYDKSDILCNAGVWVRRRNGGWEAKIRKGGDRINSQFEEVTDVRHIAAAVRNLTGTQMGEEVMFGLRKMAEFVTTRDEWLVDGEFGVVRDRTDFGHEVGEVELQVEVEGEMGEEEKRRVMGEMDERIGGFMERYAWAFGEGRAVGKLTAFFEMGGRREGRR